MAPRDANMKKKFTETQIKYLAGLIDADGSLLFHFTHYKDDVYNINLKLTLQQSLSIDKDGKYIKSLSEHCGWNQFIDISQYKDTWSDAYRWTINSRDDLNMLLPRLMKHLVIKGKHFHALFEKYNTLLGKSVSKIEMEQLKEFAIQSRKDVGPIKPKNHPTWAWTAGYLDGDGCYFMRHRKKNWGVFTELCVQVVAHDDDIVGLQLLSKAFGGKINKKSSENTHVWSRNLGNSDRQFAIAFLKKMHMHSQLKQYKIEQFLHHHLQRLNESTATAGVIV